MRSDLKSLTATVDSIAKDQALGAERRANMQRSADGIFLRLDAHDRELDDLRRWRDRADGAMVLARWALARWIRESTAGQYDRYGPASQREQQDRFIERHGLVDTGLVYQVAHSGTTVWRSPTMTDMLAEARVGAFDLLLAGYSDRWQRNLRRHPRAPRGRAASRRRRARDVRPADPLLRPTRLGRAHLGGGRRREVQPTAVRADHRRLRGEVRPPRRPGRSRRARLPAPARAAAHPRGRPRADAASRSACSSGTRWATSARASSRRRPASPPRASG